MIKWVTDLSNHIHFPLLQCLSSSHTTAVCSNVQTFNHFSTSEQIWAHFSAAKFTLSGLHQPVLSSHSCGLSPILILQYYYGSVRNNFKSFSTVDGISSFCLTTDLDIPVLLFWWRIPWISPYSNSPIDYDYCKPNETKFRFMAAEPFSQTFFSSTGKSRLWQL